MAMTISAPTCPLANNVDAALVADPERLRDGLLRQIPGAVRWEALTALLLQEGVTTFYELGPGKVLSGLVKRQAKEAGLDVAAHAVGSPDDMAALGL
jgi:[acyl-carrier-protein] S-malonyltransferase